MEQKHINQLQVQTLSAVLIRGCPSCQCPGVYKHDPAFAAWPEIQVSPDDPRLEKSVGDRCPHCGGRRDKDKNLGVIWKRTIGHESFLAKIRRLASNLRFLLGK